MRKPDESKDGQERPDREGGDTWQAEDGYGERVLDPDAGAAAAEEESERSDQTDPRGGSR